MPQPLIATCAVALPAEAPAWVQLLPLGAVQGRDGRAWSLPDRAAAEQLVAATRQRAGQLDLVIDYDHQSDYAAQPGVGGTARAAGWIRGLEIRDDGLWGQVEWTANAAQAIQAREYRYLSPVVEHLPDGRITTLLRAGLTNNPNLHLVALNSQEDPVIPAALLAALGLAATATEAEAINAAQSLTAGREGLATCAQAAGLVATASATEIVTAINAAKAVDPAKYVPIEQVATLQQQVAALSQDRAAEKAETAVNAAIKAGKLAPSLRDWGLSYAKQDLVAFNAYVEKAPAMVAQGASLSGAPPSDVNAELTPQQLAICAQLGVKPEEFKTSRGQMAASGQI